MFEQCVKVVVPMQDGDFIVIDIAKTSEQIKPC